MTQPVQRAWLSMNKRPVTRVNPVQMMKQHSRLRTMGFL